MINFEEFEHYANTYEQIKKFKSFLDKLKDLNSKSYLALYGKNDYRYTQLDFYENPELYEIIYNCLTKELNKIIKEFENDINTVS